MAKKKFCFSLGIFFFQLIPPRRQNLPLQLHTDEYDLDVISRVAHLDAETVRSIACNLPPHYYLTLGKVVRDFFHIAHT